MNRRRRRFLRRTDLFLVRMWSESGEAETTLVDAVGLRHPPNSSDASGKDEWSGSVQRVVDGEARRFTGWQSLVDTLVAMLSESKGKLDR